MKKVALTIAILALAVPTVFAGPRILNYQGSVLLPNGTPVPDGTYDMRFRLYDAQSGGTMRWEETDSAVVVTNGLFSTILGDGSPFTSQFGNFFGLWLEVAIDIDHSGSFDTDEVYSPRQRLAGAAWAVEADYLRGRSPADFAPAIHDHDSRYYTKTELNTSGGGGQVHWDNLIGVPPIGDITAVMAGPGLSGGGLSGNVGLEVTTGGIVRRMIADGAVGEAKLDTITAGAGTATDWTTISRRFIDGPTSYSYAQALIILAGEHEGGPGSVRVLLNGTAVTTYTIPTSGIRPWVFLSPPFPIAYSDRVDFQYKAASASAPLIWRRVALLFRGGEIPAPVALEGGGTGERLDLRHGDITHVDDIVFETGASPMIDLNGGDIYDVDDIYFDSLRTYYANYSFVEMANLYDSDDDYVSRYFGSGYARISSGSSPYSSAIGTGVHLPNGAVVTELRAWVYDNDPSGDVIVTLKRCSNGGGADTIASVASSSESSSVQTLTASSINYATVDNYSYHYFIVVQLEPSSNTHFADIRFYNVRIKYTLNEVSY